MFGFEESISTIAILVALIGIFIQNYSSAKIAKSRFILDINNDLNGYAETRALINNKTYKEIFKNKKSTQYERLLDYLTLFENLHHLYASKVVSLEDISEYFGGRFSELMECDFVKNHDEDQEFLKMYELLFNLKKSLAEDGLYRP